MNTQDVPGFNTIRPTDVMEYLRQSGWTPAGPARNDVIYYQFDAERLRTRLGTDQAHSLRLQILLDTTFADYARRMAEVVESVAALEHRSVLQVVNDVLTPPADIARVRTDSEAMRSGLIGLEESISLRQAVRELLLSCAHATIAPKPFYPRLGYAQALKFINECREGQTERGSYIANVYIPVSPQLQGPGEAIEDPYPRRVTKLLMNALLATADSVAQGEPSALVRQANRGVSANFLDALSQLCPPGERSFVELGISWSQSRTAPALKSSLVRFEHSSFPIFTEAARVLRESTPPVGVELEGYIVGVKREDNAVNRPGMVFLAAQLEGRPGTSKIKADLIADQYSQALDAHKSASPVKMAGMLSKEGHSFWLRSATLLEVLPAAADGEDDF